MFEGICSRSVVVVELVYDNDTLGVMGKFEISPVWPLLLSTNSTNTNEGLIALAHKCIWHLSCYLLMG